MKFPRVYYVQISAGSNVFKCQGGCPDRDHAKFYVPFFRRAGCNGLRGHLASHREERRFRVLLLAEYIGDRIEKRDGRWQITAECARAELLTKAYREGL